VRSLRAEADHLIDSKTTLRNGVPSPIRVFSNPQPMANVDPLTLNPDRADLGGSLI
jgi:hypothetical protein